MAGIKPPYQHIPPQKSFVAVLVEDHNTNIASILDFGIQSLNKGELALWITWDEMLKLSEPYNNVLVGRFPFTRPPGFEGLLPGWTL